MLIIDVAIETGMIGWFAVSSSTPGAEDMTAFAGTVTQRFADALLRGRCPLAFLTTVRFWCTLFYTSLTSREMLVTSALSCQARPSEVATRTRPALLTSSPPYHQTSCCRLFCSSYACDTNPCRY